MSSPAKCRYCHREYGSARYVSIEAVRDRMVRDECKAQRETASSEPSAFSTLLARIDRALAHARSLKPSVVAAPARPAPLTKPSTDTERAELLRFF